MKASDFFKLYRSMIATEGDEEVCWWYSGLSSLSVPDYPEIPVLRASAIMTYRTETVTEDQFKIHWSEVGCFFDHISGEPLQKWMNPITGQLTNPPTSFEEGPGTYTVTLGSDGPHIELQQPHAQVDSVSVRFQDGERARFTQTERKVRGFPLADGTLPTTEAGFKAQTDLHFLAGDSPEVCYGVYSFELDGLPPWIGLPSTAGRMLTRGTITKTRPGQSVNPLAGARLKELFPSAA
jgi:hypothetical protein